MAAKSKIVQLGNSDTSTKGQFLVASQLQEERFQKLIAEVEDYAIILLDASGTIVTWNKGAEKVKGYTAAEIIGRSYKIFYSKEDREARLPDIFLETVREKGKATHEGWRVRKDGTRFWGSVTITAVHDGAGELAGYMKVTRDLTERKISEDKYSNYVEELRIKNEELKQSEDRYHKMVMEVSDYVIILLDKDGKVLDWNKGAEKIKGYKPQEIIGKSFRLFYTKEDKEANLPEKLLQSAVNNGSVTHEGWRIRKDGTKFWGNVTITALHSDAGEIFGFSKVTRDLTERKIAEDQLNNLADELRFKNDQLMESEERYHKMISEVQDYAIILLDKDGIIQNWNTGAKFIKGYSADEIVGTSFERFYPPADKEAGLPGKLMAEAAEKGKAVHEGWRVKKDGSTFWGYIVITALRNDSDEIIGYSKVTRDLTSKKQADDLIQLNALELERKNRSLERLNEEISSFAFVASHDLQEPVRKIRTFASRIVEADDLDTARSFAGKIENSALRMQKLIKDLLSYSKVSSDETVLKKIDLNSVLKQVIDDLELLISEKKAVVKIDKLPGVLAVEFQLYQLFFNLITNALKFSKPDETPVIRISSSRVQGKDIPLGLVNDLKSYNKVSVADNGIGFEIEDSKKIFEVFHRLHPQTEFSGTGIGLAVVKRVMEKLNGIVVADAKPSEGATFDLYFPAI